MSRDPWMAILEQRNTLDELASPNEKLNSRRTRTVNSEIRVTRTPPQASHELQSRSNNRTRGIMIRKQSRYPLLL